MRRVILNGVGKCVTYLPVDCNIEAVIVSVELLHSVICIKAVFAFDRETGLSFLVGRFQSIGSTGDHPLSCPTHALTSGQLATECGQRQWRSEATGSANEDHIGLGTVVDVVVRTWKYPGVIQQCFLSEGSKCVNTTFTCSPAKEADDARRSFELYSHRLC